jgi:hypothetical protein
MTYHTVQRLWRLIAFAQIAVVGGLCLALAGCESREAAATANGPARAEMRVGGFRQITGTGFLMASAYAKKESGVLEKFESGSYSDSYGRSATQPVHNLLFASLDDLSGRWLLSHNRFLIWATEELPPEKDKSIIGVYVKDQAGVGVLKVTNPEQRVARWIYIEVVKSDTNNNGKWDHEDRKAIAIVDPSGANYVEVITDTDEILQRTMHLEDKLSVVYQSNAKLFISNIDLPQRQVTTKDLPAIP